MLHLVPTRIWQVDCTADESKDLCLEQEVHSYPTLVLFHKGTRKAEYKEARDLQSLMQFITEQAKI